MNIESWCVYAPEGRPATADDAVAYGRFETHANATWPAPLYAVIPESVKSLSGPALFVTTAYWDELRETGISLTAATFKEAAPARNRNNNLFMGSAFLFFMLRLYQRAAGKIIPFA